MSTPKIEDYYISPMELVGLTTHFRGAMEPDADYDVVIPALWQRLDDQVAAGRILGDRRFGLITVNDVPGVMRYDACILPTGGDTSALSSVSFPGGRYVCVEHEGTLEALADTVRWFYGEYLLTAPYELIYGAHVEMYDQRFTHDATSVMTVGAPYRFSRS